ncbi:MAG: DUF3179 domain-containing protein [Candidatus Omnitrophica bacterium]|nr:DUF3179 domain-containing protein [Candidatus Omnitrophota bacterium]MBI3083452.1 DUF3179 domain-containing protein [Candidatus Omnitrophota bacterium]
MKTVVWWLALGLLWPQAPPTALAESFDLSKSSVPREEILSGGPPKDGIPALTNPQVVSGEAATYLRADDRVLGVAMGDQARAYPIRILNWHEVVNDRLDGAPVVVTYCPLCGTGMVFRAERRGQRVFFGVSGLLYNSDVLLYDRETESLWSQLKMEAVAGPRLGENLEWLPAQHTTWQAWRTAYPHTDVLSLNTGYDRDYGRDPYAGYATNSRLMFPVRHQDPRLAPKEWVAGVLIDGQPNAYPLKRLSSGRVLEDQIGGQTLHVLYDANARSVQVTDANTSPVPVVQAYWFAWSAFYPSTGLYEP